MADPDGEAPMLGTSEDPGINAIPDPSMLDEIAEVGPLPYGSGRSKRLSRPAIWAITLVVAFIGGALVFRASFAEAFAHAATGGNPAYHYGLYWIAMAIFMVPATVRLLHQDNITLTERYSIIAAMAVFTYIPRVLRSPDTPLYFDEFAHWEQSENLFRTGLLFQPNIVDVIQSYPGLHTVTVALRHVTGLSTYNVGLLIGGLSHVLEMIGVFILARRIFASFRIGAFAAVVYAANPGFLLFTAQYAYETLALIFVTWVIVFMGEVSRHAVTVGLRRRWAGVMAVMICATAITHHLSSFFLVGVLVVNALVARPWKKGQHRQASRLAMGVALFAIFINLAWVLGLGREVIGYLAPFPKQGFDQLMALFNGQQADTGGSRQAFQGSALPVYETMLAFVCPVIVSAAVAVGAWRHRSRWRDSPVYAASLLIALCYSASMPLVLTTSGAPGAHRSWPFSYVAVSVFVSAALITTSWRGRKRPKTERPRLRSVALATPLCIAFVTVLFLGNSGSENNDENRFPGPWAPSSDARTVTPELLQIAEWTKRTQGEGHVFVADFATGGVFGAVAGQSYDDGFPTWDLFFYGGDVNPNTLARLKSENVRYMLIDNRLAELGKRPDYYFVPEEPDSYSQAQSITDGSLSRYLTFPWTTKIYSTEHYSLYRFELDQLNRPVLPGAPIEAGEASAS